MATVNFCERCNTMAKSSAMGRLDFWPGAGHDSKQLELCPGCVGDMIEFLGAAEKNPEDFSDRPKSYSQPYTIRVVDPLAGLSDEQLAKAYLARVAERETANELTAGPEDGSL